MSGIAFVVKCENILASLYVTRKRSRLTSVQSSVTGLYGVRHSPLLLLTLGKTNKPFFVKVPNKNCIIIVAMTQTPSCKML